MEPILRPVEPGGAAQAARNHIRFVEDRDLDQNVREIWFGKFDHRKRLAEQAAGGLLKDIDANENDEAAANEQKPAGSGNEATLAEKPEQIDGIQRPSPHANRAPSGFDCAARPYWRGGQPPRAARHFLAFGSKRTRYSGHKNRQHSSLNRKRASQATNKLQQIVARPGSFALYLGSRMAARVRWP